MSQIHYIDEEDISGKRILLRADFDVSLNPDFTIADDIRISQNIPTIKYLVERKNKIICVAKLDRPKSRDPKLSLAVVVKRLQEYLPENKITLVDDFLTEDTSIFRNQSQHEILVLENIRFYPEEKEENVEFAKKLASLADVYVNDAFAVCHRSETSVVGVPKLLPSYGGLLLKKEIEMISKTIQNPQKPCVAIIGGAKVSTKIDVLDRLATTADYVLIGGGLANTFLVAKGYNLGKSFYEADQVEKAKTLLNSSIQRNTKFLIPQDAVVGPSLDATAGTIVKVENVPLDNSVLDIGPETQAEYGAVIAKAKTIIWNGPVGYIENGQFRRGTDFIYYAITHNTEATSILGGGDTLAAISKKEYLDKITHISTGGGAMLEFIEKGTLPGLEALKR